MRPETIIEKLSGSSPLHDVYGYDKQCQIVRDVLAAAATVTPIETSELIAALEARGYRCIVPEPPTDHFVTKVTDKRIAMANQAERDGIDMLQTRGYEAKALVYLQIAVALRELAR